MAETNSKVIDLEEQKQFVADYGADAVRAHVSNRINTKYKDNLDYEFTDITLKRILPGGKMVNVEKYEDLPEWTDIKEEHGGGNYKLRIQWRPLGGNSDDRDHDVISLSIEGPQKKKTEDKNQTDRIEDDIEKLARLKVLINGGNENNSTQLILENINKNHEATLKLMETFINKKSSGFNVTPYVPLIAPVITALVSLFKQGKSADLTQFLELYRFFQENKQDSPAKGIDWATLIPSVIGLVKDNPNIQSALPAGLMEKINEMDGSLKQLNEKIEVVSDDNPGDTDRKGKLEALKLALTMMPAESIFRFSKGQGLITDLAEFNSMLQELGEDIIQENIET